MYPNHTTLQYFAYEHLPPHLQAVSKPFCELARQLVDLIPLHSHEADKALDRLLEAKDAAVRASLVKE